MKKDQQRKDITLENDSLIEPPSLIDESIYMFQISKKGGANESDLNIKDAFS